MTFAMELKCETAHKYRYTEKGVPPHQQHVGDLYIWKHRFNGEAPKQIIINIKRVTE